jgi:amino acid transporter
MVISVFGVMGYAEEEFWVSLLKLFTIVIFLIMGVVFTCGGGPANGQYNTYQGGTRWQNPGAFADGFLGVCRTFVTAAFAFSGTELVGLAAAESKTPQKSLPGAIKQVFWRITLFYILSLTFIGLLVDHDDERLLGSGLIDVSASPFVIVAENAGIPAFGVFVNVVIMFAVVSIGLSGVYGGSRTLTALAEQGYAPKVFSYIDRAGRPLWSTIAIIAFGPIAYVGIATSGELVFAWLLSLSGLAALFTWGSICVAHIRFRSAWKHQGRSLDEIPFKAAGGAWGSWLGFSLIVLVLIAQVNILLSHPLFRVIRLTLIQFYTALYAALPIRETNGGGGEGAEGFFLAYLAVPVVIVFYVIGVVWKRKTWIPISKIDVDSGRRELDMVLHEETLAKYRAKGPFGRFMSKII